MTRPNSVGTIFKNLRISVTDLLRSRSQTAGLVYDEWIDRKVELLPFLAQVISPVYNLYFVNITVVLKSVCFYCYVINSVYLMHNP